jgi:hypothetical protein
MDIERSIEQWNARWTMIAGRMVCTSCMESQHIEDCEKRFVHDHGCESESEDVKPWVALHNALDAQRG